MNVYSTVSKLIFAGMTTVALSSAAMAQSDMDQQDTQSMEDDAPISSTDQDGMAGKDSANHEEMEEGMDHDGMSDDHDGMGMEQDGMPNDQPMDHDDQEGMESKDSANHEEMEEEM